MTRAELMTFAAKLGASRAQSLRLAIFGVLAVVCGLARSDEKPDEKPRWGFAVSRETTVLTQPLTPDGLVDYVAAVNQLESEGVTPENNAVVALITALGPSSIPEPCRREFFAALGIDPLPDSGRYLLTLDRFAADTTADLALVETNQFHLRDQLRKARTQPWSEDDLPELDGWLDRNAGVIDAIVEASSRTRYYEPLVRTDENRFLVDVDLMVAQRFREPLSLLSARGMHRFGAGDAKGGSDDIFACHRLARLSAQGPTAIHTLVGIAMENGALNAWLDLLRAGRLTADDAQRVLQELWRMPPVVDLVQVLDERERLASCELMMHLAAGEHAEVLRVLEDSPDSRFSMFIQQPRVEHLLMHGVDWNESLRAINRWVDRKVRIARQPAYRARMEAEDRQERDLARTGRGIDSEDDLFAFLTVGDRTQTGRRICDLLARLILIPTRELNQAEFRLQARRRLTETALALRVFQQGSGRYPARLADLVPAILPAVPDDPCSGRALIYVPKGAGYLLYSVDLNEVDDAGRESADPLSGDLVIRVE